MPALQVRAVDPARDRGGETIDDEHKQYGNRFTLGAAPRASLGLARLTDSKASVPGMFGVGVFGAARLVYGLRLGLAAGAERILEGPYGNGSPVGWNTGVVLGAGAPFDATRFGLYAEAGYHETFDTKIGRQKSFREQRYLRGGVLVNIMSTSTSRMWAGLSPMLIEDHVFAGLDIGGAWDPG
jgi:hypothetical protein